MKEGKGGKNKKVDLNPNVSINCIKCILNTPMEKKKKNRGG